MASQRKRVPWWLRRVDWTGRRRRDFVARQRLRAALEAEAQDEARMRAYLSI
jgi:hypothetical protein